MNQKTRNITGWILTGLLALVFIGSAAMKLATGAEAAKTMESIGLTATSIKLIGTIELLSIVLFIIPRTGLLGTLLLSAYLGGAIVTHLEHGQPFTAPALVQCLLWITATIRFPELSRRLAGGTVQ